MMAQRTVLLARVFLIAFKFLFFFVCSKFFSAHVVATLFFINLFVTIATMILPLETHYNFVRNFQPGQTNIGLFKRHFSSLIVTCSLMSLLLFGLLEILPDIFPNYLTERQYYGLIAVVLLEAINTDAYRYFQIGDIKGQIANLFLRSFLPFAGFLAAALPDHGLADANFMIACLFISSAASAAFSLSRLGWPMSVPDMKWFSPDLSHIKVSLTVAMPILLAQLIYTQLDKYLAASVLGKADYANYSFYSSIGQAALLYAQITFIQPRLAHWYAEGGRTPLNLQDLSKKMGVIGGLLVAGTGVLFAGSDLLPPVLRPSAGSFGVLAGHLPLAAATAASAYLYASRRDSAALNGDLVVSILAIAVLACFGLRYIDGRWLFAYPATIFTAAFVVKILVVRRG